MARKLVTACIFRRTEKDNLESGIAIGVRLGDIAVIIDHTNNIVPAPIYSYECRPLDGLIWLEV